MEVSLIKLLSWESYIAYSIKPEIGSKVHLSKPYHHVNQPNCSQVNLFFALLERSYKLFSETYSYVLRKAVINNPWGYNITHIHRKWPIGNISSSSECDASKPSQIAHLSSCVACHALETTKSSFSFLLWSNLFQTSHPEPLYLRLEPAPLAKRPPEQQVALFLYECDSSALVDWVV